ncbi:MAG: hypothetical protein U1E45_16685 [Geminicoccaceae bacterium]
MAVRRVAVGQDAAAAARACGMGEAEIQAMLGDARMAKVLATYRDLLVLPDPIRLKMLDAVCMQVVLEAVEEREPRVCVWYFHESSRDRLPWEVLARSLERMLKRKPPAVPLSRPPVPPEPLACDPMSDAYAARARLRVLAQLRLRVLEELADRRADLLDELGHDPAKPAPASLDWSHGIAHPPMPGTTIRVPVPEPRAGP